MTKSLWKISVETSADAEDAVTELLSATFGQPASAYHDLETGKTTINVFLSKEAEFRKAKPTILEGLDRIRECGLASKVPKLACHKIRREDWAESWKRHFKPVAFGGKLLIKPSWSRRRTKAGRAVVILDPGLSFGTGRHPTTSFCLAALARFSSGAKEKGGFLDAGTGSGILAISAAKLGFSPVDAFDFDPDALRIAKANARRNRVDGKIRFTRTDAREFRSARTYSIICANLSTDVLGHAIHRLAACLQKGGLLVLAGILKKEFASVQAIAEKAGLQFVRKRSETEWTSGTFRQ